MKIQIKDVRLSFPSLFQKSSFNGVEGKYEATFLIPKSDVETKSAIDNLIEEALEKHKSKIPSSKRCIYDGDEKEYDGYFDHWAFKCSSSRRPPVIDRDRSALAEDDGKLYPGCYVNALVGVWIQDNSFGKRVNGNLYGVQFVRDGDEFGSGSYSTELFDDLDVL